MTETYLFNYAKISLKLQMMPISYSYEGSNFDRTIMLLVQYRYINDMNRNLLPVTALNVKIIILTHALFGICAFIVPSNRTLWQFDNRGNARRSSRNKSSLTGCGTIWVLAHVPHTVWELLSYKIVVDSPRLLAFRVTLLHILPSLL